MSMESVKRVLMRRDGCTSEDADELIDEARARVASGDDPEDVLQEEFGLEPDYIWDLL